MSAGITISPGTFLAAPPPSPIRAGEAWPVAASGWKKKRPMQWNSMPHANVLDDSPLMVAPFDMGYMNYLFGIYPVGLDGTRTLPFSLEWRNMPADHSVEVVGRPPVAAMGSGQCAANMAFRFGPTPRGANYLVPEYVEAVANDLDGKAFHFTSTSVVVGLVIGGLDVDESSYDYKLWMGWTILVRRTSTNAILRSFSVYPRFTTVMTTRYSAPSSGTLPASGRAMRIIYNGGVYTLETPNGFIVS